MTAAITLHTPERMLVAAMVRQALEDLFKLDASRDAYRSAERWLVDRSTRRWSFEWCCALMDLEPDKVRQAIAERPQEIQQRLAQFARSLRVLYEVGS